MRTFVQCLVAIIRCRNNAQVLWLSELGSYLDGYGGEACSAAAGTKRVGKLLRSVKWTVMVIERYLLERADEEVQKLKGQGKRILYLWDGSVVEKAESERGEGLCPVLSSKAKRRSRTKRGLVFNWPAPRPVRVMGMQWTAALIVGMHGLPHLALSRWWTTKGVFATRLRDTEEEALRVCIRKWGPLLVHVFDRGYASANWLAILGSYRARFVIRWIGKHVFLSLAGEEKKLWEIGRGKKYRAHKEIWDTNTGEKMPVDLWWTALGHPQSGQPLFLVKARVKKGVMYLITNETVKTEVQAWDIFFSRARGVGRLKRVFAMRNANWRWNVRVCGHWRHVSSCLAWSCSFMRFCSPYLILCITNWCKHFYVSSVIGPESGARIRQHRFIDCVGHSVASGTITVLD